MAGIASRSRMTDLPEPTASEPGADTPSRPQRVSLEGTVATLSALSAIIVAATSMFTAAQALGVSKQAAQQKIFETQLGVCLQFSELTTKAADEGAKTAGLLEGTLDDAAWAAVNARIEAGDAISNDIYKQYLSMTMVLPDEVSDLAYKATEKRAEISNKQIEMLENEAVTPQALAELSRLSDQESDLLTEAAAACRDYVSSKAGV